MGDDCATRSCRVACLMELDLVPIDEVGRLGDVATIVEPLGDAEGEVLGDDHAHDAQRGARDHITHTVGTAVDAVKATAD